MILQLPPLPDSLILGLKDAELKRLREKNPRIPAGPKNCVTCKGKKIFKSATLPGLAPTYRDGMKIKRAAWENLETECNCPDQWLLHTRFSHSNIGLTYQRYAWTDIENVEKGAIEKVDDYLANLHAYIDAGCGLVLYGDMGTGKTMLSTLVLKRAIAEGYDGYCTSVDGLLDIYKRGWRDDAENMWFHQRIKNTTVLVLDDLGRETAGSQVNSFIESALDGVIRHRIANSAATIITTNLTMPQIEKNYGQNIWSLLHERSTTYEFKGDDFRNRTRLRLDEETRSGLTRPVVIG